MSVKLRCSQGHQWETDKSATTEETCPVCGALGETLDEGASLADSDELPPPPNSEPDQASETMQAPQAAEPLRGDTPASHADAQSPVAADASDRQGLPDIFGRYEVIERLGRGGMGSVYLAKDTKLDRHVALKVPHFAAVRDSSFLERFRREARAAATLDHPNICPVYDVGELDGIHYISMAYVEGRPLSRLIKQQHPLPQRGAADLVRKLALALEEAHQAGVIHRDLKPDNIMINQRHEPVIMDFGLARRDKSQDVRLTSDRDLMGSPAYMAPEQARGGNKQTGVASDIYSLGVVLYELLSGRLPFEGSLKEILESIISRPVPVPTTYRADLDAQVERICMKALNKEPAERFTTMGEFAAALEGYIGAAKDVEAIGAASAETDRASHVDGKKFSSSDMAKDLLEKLAARIESAVASGSQQRIRPRWSLWVAAALLLAVLAGFTVPLLPNPQTGQNGQSQLTIHVHFQIPTEIRSQPDVSFWFNGKRLSDQQLQDGISVEPGDYTLKVKRGDEDVWSRTIPLSAEDDGKPIAVREPKKTDPEPPKNEIASGDGLAIPAPETTPEPELPKQSPNPRPAPTLLDALHDGSVWVVKGVSEAVDTAGKSQVGTMMGKWTWNAQQRQFLADYGEGSVILNVRSVSDNQMTAEGANDEIETKCKIELTTNPIRLKGYSDVSVDGKLTWKVRWTAHCVNPPQLPIVRYEPHGSDQNDAMGALSVEGTGETRFAFTDVEGHVINHGSTDPNAVIEVAPGTYRLSLNGFERTVLVKVGQRAIVETGRVRVLLPERKGEWSWRLPGERYKQFHYARHNKSVELFAGEWFAKPGSLWLRAAAEIPVQIISGKETALRAGAIRFTSKSGGGIWAVNLGSQELTIAQRGIPSTVNLFEGTYDALHVQANTRGLLYETVRFPNVKVQAGKITHVESPY